MELCIISGGSRGLGTALTALLSNDGSMVYSLSRTPGSAAGAHIACDFTDPALIANTMERVFADLDFSGIKAIMLINNAGMLQPIGPTSLFVDEELIDNLSVNLLAPILLTTHFLRKTERFPGRKVVVNISSGAAVKPYDGWSLYCAAKSGLEHYTRCVALEQTKTDFPATIINVNPGVMDTGMQEQIRTSDRSRFSSRQRFVDLNSAGKLTSPQRVAEILIREILTGALISGQTYNVQDYLQSKG